MRAESVRKQILDIRLDCHTLGEAIHQVWVDSNLPMEIEWAVKAAVRNANGLEEK
jgi:hypothetical protein